MQKTRSYLLNIGHAEGISFLALLFIAMPLKYMADMPLVVRIVGSLHGLLFVLFIAALFEAYRKLNLSLLTTAIAFALSIIPFGTFFLHRMIPAKQEPLG